MKHTPREKVFQEKICKYTQQAVTLHVDPGVKPIAMKTEDILQQINSFALLNHMQYLNWIKTCVVTLAWGFVKWRNIYKKICTLYYVNAHCLSLSCKVGKCVYIVCLDLLDLCKQLCIYFIILFNVMHQLRVNKGHMHNGRVNNRVSVYQTKIRIGD